MDKVFTMTLGEFLNVCDQSGSIILFYFTAIPLVAALAWGFGRGEGHLSPWKYLYTALIYLACVPGIFAVTLNVYLFFFERTSILNANLYTQILPILSMLVTLWIIRRNVDFDDIPGFNKIGSLFLLLILLFAFLWVLEKTQLFVISFMPFHFFILLFAAALISIRLTLKKMF